MTVGTEFLPISRADMEERGWDRPDFVYVCGDAYVDHPSFGAAIISRVLEEAGFRVAMLSQPDYHSCESFQVFGRPRLGFLVSAGNIDSMVAHYTAAGKKRSYDYYSPGGKTGLRPDRACIVYTNRIREAYGDVPVILGGLEASLRRMAHYDYWDNAVRHSVLVDSGADLLTYGMGENIIRRIAFLLDKGIPVGKLHDIRGTVYLTSRDDKPHYPVAGEWDYDKLKSDKRLYAEAFGVQYKNTDAVSAKAMVEYYGSRMLVQNPPMPPLERKELDAVYALPYTRKPHPIYDKMGGVPAIAEVEMSITHNRGCFGACSFCAIAYHQGRTVRSRSVESVVEEARMLTALPNFKGYINDVGGPTANFRYPSCKQQLENGVCQNRRCLAPTPCKNLEVDHSEYIELLRKIEALPKVKKVFIRSGIRFDYVMADKDDSFMKKLVHDHVSGQLKVAPEHCAAEVLREMGKPEISVFEAFKKRYFELSKSYHLDQYLVPYLMSSHPGSRLSDAVELACYIKSWGYEPEQVQDFYPTPGTASTVMYYTGIDPLTMRSVYCPSDADEKRMQRALLQWRRPENAPLVREALKRCHREDLIGYAPECLVKPEQSDIQPNRTSKPRTDAPSRSKKDVSSRSRTDAPSRSKKDVSSRSRTDVPSRSKKDVSSRSRTDAPSRSKKDALSDRKYGGQPKKASEKNRSVRQLSEYTEKTKKTE